MIIVPSGKPKIWDKEPDCGSVKAESVYIGTFHRLAKAYAVKFAPGNYVILSPFYGFLRPDDIVPATYDVRFTLKGVTSKTIQIYSLQLQWQKLDIAENESIIILGGKKYLPLMQQIAYKQAEITAPLIGLGGIGKMQQALKRAVQEGIPL